MSERLEKALLILIRIGTAIILFLPIFVYRSVLYPYIFSKIMVFQIIVEIMLVAWLALVLYAKKREKYQINWKNPIVIGLSAFMGLLVLTMLTGLDLNRSFWSTQERMTGVLSLLHFYVWFLILISSSSGQTSSLVSSDKKDNHKTIRFFIWISLASSFLVGLYGLAQKYFPVWGIEWDFILKGSARMQSTLGNPIFLAIYAMLNVFLAGIIFVKTRKKIGKILGFILGVFNIWIMLLAASRGVMLAFVASLILTFVFILFNASSKRVKAGAVILIILILSGAIFVQTPKFKEQAQEMPLFVRQLTNYSSGAEARLDAWSIGLKGFAQRPLIGWGWENYNLVFNQYYEPGYLAKGYDATWFDKSHNQLIDILALTGLGGLLAYLFLFGAIFWWLFKKIKTLNHFKEKLPFLFLGSLFSAYFIQNLFVFDTPAPLILFYFSLALVYLLTLQVRPVTQVAPVRRFPLPVFILLVLLFLPFSLYKFNLEPIQQSHLGRIALEKTKINFKAGIKDYEQVLAKPCFVNPEIRVYLAQNIAQAHAEIDEKTDLQTLGLGTELAIKEYEKSVQEHPRDARQWLYLGQLYGLGAKYNPPYLDQAEQALLKAQELSPQRQQVYFQLGRIYYFSQEYAQALWVLQQALVFAPQVGESKNNLNKMIKAIEKEAPDLEELAKAKKFLEYLNQ